MNRLFITALLASVAFAPAYAGKDKVVDRLIERQEEKAFDKYEDKIERLEGRLEDATDDERQRIENIIESVTEKYEAKWGELPEEPPPPPPEPVTDQLFKDDFKREDGSGLGNGWTELGGTDNSIRVEGQKAVLQTLAPCGSQCEDDPRYRSAGYMQSPVFHEDYKSASLSYTAGGLAGAGVVESWWTVNGNKWILGESTTVAAGTTATVSFKLEDSLSAYAQATENDPGEFLGSVEDGNFAMRFTFIADNGLNDNTAFVDDVSLTLDSSTTAPFVGY